MPERIDFSKSDSDVILHPDQKANSVFDKVQNCKVPQSAKGDSTQVHFHASATLHHGDTFARSDIHYKEGKVARFSNIDISPVEDVMFQEYSTIASCSVASPKSPNILANDSNEKEKGSTSPF